MPKTLIISSLVIGALVSYACSKPDAEPQVVSYETNKQTAIEQVSAMPISRMAKNILGRAAEDLKVTLPTPGLNLGDKAPEFLLPDANGKTVSLRDTLKQGPVVLVFYRGSWCPFCNAYLGTLKQNFELFKKAGAQLIAISPQVPDKSLEQLIITPLPFPILSDLDFDTIKAYNLYFELGPGLHRVYQRLGIDLDMYNGPGRLALPVAATFIINSDGLIHGGEAHLNYKERMEPAKILEVLKGINEK